MSILAQTIIANLRDRKARSKYGRETDGIYDLSETYGVHAYRRHRWSKKVALFFDLPDRTVEAVLTLTETWPWQQKLLASGLYLWSALLIGEVRSGVLKPSGGLSSEDRKRLRLENPIVRALVASGHSDNVIRSVALSMARHYEEAERKQAEETHRQEALRISRLKIGKPPQPPYGNELIDEKLSAFGVRAYRGSQGVTFVFRLPDPVRDTHPMHEVAIAPRLPPGYWAGGRLKINHVTEMLAAAGREFRNFQSGSGSIEDPIDNSILRCWRDAFLESGYGDEIFRQVALQMAEKEPHVRGSAGDSTPKTDANPDTPQAASKQQRDWLRREWSLVLVQLTGAVVAIYVSANGTRYDYKYYDHFYRLVICGLSAYSAYVAGVSRRVGWAWLFGVVATIYSPLVPVHMRPHEWDASNLVVGLIFVASALRTAFAGVRQNK